MGSVALNFATRVLIGIVKHPATHQFGKALLRSATAELVRAVRNHTRTLNKPSL